ncbi:MAG: porin [Polaromonas sp.]|uniref:porin n=1 Tax=Polaromonas sp. TaxID=1869339 RepID=UPI0017D4A93A|nr:porin [Polaromonas sp.]NMM11761.1 porin [Polaromonas sp.]
MKKTLIALAALGAMAGVAHAQSTVTIYGLLDANFGSYKTNVNVGDKAAVKDPVTGLTLVPAVFGSVQNLTQTKIDSGGLNGSRWGIRVNEDIGGGMAVVGNLESGLNLDTGSSGQGGLLFGRRANVGISSGFGTVTIGRNSSSYDDVSADHTMMAQTIFDPSNNNNGNSAAVAGTLGTAAGAAAFLGNRGDANSTWIGFNTRFNNSIKYNSPNFSGFSGSVMYGFGEDKTQTVSASKTVSANLKYANGPLLVSGGYQTEGGVRTATTEPSLRNTLLSVAYDFGVAKVGAGFNRAKYKDVTAPASLGGGEIAAQREYSLSVAVPLGATTLSAGYAQSKGDTLGKSSGYGIQALYSLSKRTTLYTGAESSKAFDKLADATAAASSAGGVQSNIGRITTYALGIRHTF